MNKKIIITLVSIISLQSSFAAKGMQAPKQSPEQALESFQQKFCSCNPEQFSAAVAVIATARVQTSSVNPLFSLMRRSDSTQQNNQTLFDPTKLHVIAVESILKNCQPEQCIALLQAAEISLNTTGLLKTYFSNVRIVPTLAKRPGVLYALHEQKSSEIDYEKTAITVATEPTISLELFKFLIAARPQLLYSDTLMQEVWNRYLFATQSDSKRLSREYSDSESIIIKSTIQTKSSLEQAKYLLEQRFLHAQKNAQDQQSKQILNRHTSILRAYLTNPACDYLEILNLLLQNGANPNLRNEKNNTALDDLIYIATLPPTTFDQDRLTLFKELIDRGAHFQKPNEALINLASITFKPETLKKEMLELLKQFQEPIL